MRSHQPRYQLRGRGVAPVLPRIGYDRIRQAMLVVNRDHRQAHPVPHVTTQGLEVGDDEVDLPICNQFLELVHTLRRLPHRDKVFGKGAFVAHAIVHISKAEAKDFRNLKQAAEVAHPPVERSDVQRVTLIPQMSKNFLRPSRVPSAFTVNSIKDVGHRSKQYKAGGSHNIRVAKRRHSLAQHVSAGKAESEGIESRQGRHHYLKRAYAPTALAELLMPASLLPVIAGTS
jgi:hypothetical protein